MNNHLVNLSILEADQCLHRALVGTDEDIDRIHQEIISCGQTKSKWNAQSKDTTLIDQLMTSFIITCM